jgi:hypothetical protein
MRKAPKAFSIIVAIALSSCAATVTKPAGEARPFASSATPTKVALLITGSPAIQASADWNTFRAEWRTAFASAATSAGLPFTYLHAEGGTQPPGVILVRVAVIDYRYLTSASRYGFGVMTGNAYINAHAEFFEFPGRQSIGTRTYTSSSSAWEGAFSAMTDKQVLAISKAIIQDIKRK